MQQVLLHELGESDLPVDQHVSFILNSLKGSQGNTVGFCRWDCQLGAFKKVLVLIFF